MPLKFHWGLPRGGESAADALAHDDDDDNHDQRRPALPDVEAQTDFCRRAEQCGIDSVFIDSGSDRPDPALLAAALGLATERIRFIVAHRPGLMSPATFVQQLNTLSALIRGRFSLHVAADDSARRWRTYGDFLADDESYARADEFLSVCRAFWGRDGGVNFEGAHYQVEGGRLNTPFIADGRSHPEIFVAGDSRRARSLAARRGTCWVLRAARPERVASESADLLRRGVEVGLRASVVTRGTRREAERAASALVEGATATGGSGAAEGESGGVSVESRATLPALVGTPEEVAAAVVEYGRAGVSQFILSGRPESDEMERFGRDVLPLVRRAEAAAVASKPEAGASKSEAGA